MFQAVAAERPFVQSRDVDEAGRDERHVKELNAALALVTAIGGELLVDKDAKPLRQLYNDFRREFNLYIAAWESHGVGAERAKVIEKHRQELSRLAIEIQEFAENQLDELNAPPSLGDLAREAVGEVIVNGKSSDEPSRRTPQFENENTNLRDGPSGMVKAAVCATKYCPSGLGSSSGKSRPKWTMTNNSHCGNGGASALGSRGPRSRIVPFFETKREEEAWFRQCKHEDELEYLRNPPFGEACEMGRRARRSRCDRRIYSYLFVLWSHRRCRLWRDDLWDPLYYCLDALHGDACD